MIMKLGLQLIFCAVFAFPAMIVLSLFLLGAHHYEMTRPQP